MSFLQQLWLRLAPPLQTSAPDISVDCDSLDRPAFTEFNGFGGSLISLALVPEDPDAHPFYEALDCANPDSWAAAHVLPVLAATPISRQEMTARLAKYLRGDPEPVVIADWPEDIAHLAMLLVTGPGFRTALPKFVFELLDLPLFHSETSSDVPHNAQHDARALRAYVLAEERPWPGASGPLVSG